MKEHREAGMKLPEGVSAETAFDVKKKLLDTVNQFHGTKELENEKQKYSCHVEEFKNHYELTENGGKPCGAVRK